MGSEAFEGRLFTAKDVSIINLISLCDESLFI